MSKKGILLLQSTTDDQIATIKKLAPDYEIVKGWDSNEITFPLKDIEIIYGWDKSKGQIYYSLPDSSLKWIQAPSAGVDYMDLNLLKEKEIALTTSSGIHARSIAESVFGMILSYYRGIGCSIKNQSKKVWDRSGEIHELFESTIMIVGAGHVGQQIGSIAKAFGMTTIGVNRSGSNAAFMDITIPQTEITNYLEKADIVVNILPLTELTRDFYNKTLFSKMKKGTILINVGRGPSVHVDDLLEALDNGILAFAGLDVFDKEPLPSDSPLWEREDVLITPHTSGLIRHFKARLFSIFEENLKAYVKGQELPRNKVDYNRSY